MKKLFLSFAVLLTAAGCFAQAAPPAIPVAKAEDIIQFKEKSHDFGKIKQGVPVTYDFLFKNISKKTVVIESATASCGCTTPVKPDQPIAKGKSNKIKAGFNAAAPGAFTKTITIKVSDVAMPMTIEIKGEVLSADAFAKYEADKTKNSK
jgi:hypothetical protein